MSVSGSRLRLLDFLWNFQKKNCRYASIKPKQTISEKHEPLTLALHRHTLILVSAVSLFALM